MGRVYTPEALKKIIRIVELDENEERAPISFIEVLYPNKERIPIIEKIEDDGRAQLYLCVYDGKKMLYRELYNPIIPMNELYMETKAKIDSGRIPGKWPVACTEYYNDKFGYITEYDLSFKNVKYFSSLRSKLLACRNIVKIFGVLHNKGFCFQHLAGFSNFDIDYENGNVRVTNADEILLLGKFNGIARNSLETAPELYMNRKPPTVESDRYSLAILLFEFFFETHPLIGKN